MLLVARGLAVVSAARGDRPWNMAVVGLGVAGRSAVTAARALPGRVTVTRSSDADVAGAAEWASTLGLPVTEDIEQVCRADDVDVVYIASPSALHREHAELAARHGKHLLIEKPMATSVVDCAAVVHAAEQHGVQALAVHTPSFEAPVRTARAVIESGELGRVLQLTQVKYVPWLARPRLAHELDNGQGGGVLNRQAPHQIDVALGVLTGSPSTVFATVGSHPDLPGTDGHYTAMITFSDASVATLTFNGYGYFASSALTGGVGEDGYPELPGAGARLRVLRHADKHDMRSGRIHAVEHGYEGAAAKYPAMNGWTLISCEGGDLVFAPSGLIVHRPTGSGHRPYLDTGSFLAEALDELDEAVRTTQAPQHDARWGMRIVEVLEAVRSSARTGRTVDLVAG